MGWCVVLFFFLLFGITNLVTHAVLRPASVRPTAARRPAPPAPTTMALDIRKSRQYVLQFKQINIRWQHELIVVIYHSLIPDSSQRSASSNNSLARYLTDMAEV